MSATAPYGSPAPIMTTQEDWTRSDLYHNSFLIPADPILDAAITHSEENGLPDISVTAAQGRFLNITAKSIRARKILEVGTLGGYSTIWLARALPPDGEVITLEVDEHHAKVARENLQRAGFSEPKVKVIVGRGVDTLPTLGPDGSFDLAFIDADKPSNLDYFLQAKRLVRKGGIIIVDNVVRQTTVSDLSQNEERIEGVRRLLRHLKDDRAVEAATIHTVGEKGLDGFLEAIVL